MQEFKNPFRRDDRPLFAMTMIFCRLRRDDVRADEFEFRTIWDLIHHFRMVGEITQKIKGQGNVALHIESYPETVCPEITEQFDEFFFWHMVLHREAHGTVINKRYSEDPACQ